MTDRMNSIPEAEVRAAKARLEALANLIERPPLDDVLLKQSVAMNAASDIRLLLSTLRPSDSPSKTEGLDRGTVEALVYEAQFLIDRINDLDWCDFEQFAREWEGHVVPPLARLKSALSDLTTTDKGDRP